MSSSKGFHPMPSPFPFDGPSRRGVSQTKLGQQTATQGRAAVATISTRVMCLRAKCQERSSTLGELNNYRL